MIRMYRARRAQRWQSDDGISLIELLMAVMILGIVMSAFSASLIHMLQATSRNEQDVQATAIAQEMSEELLVSNWDNALLYEDEVAAANVRWKSRTTVAGDGSILFEGLELVSVPKPDTAPVDGAETPADVQAPSETITRGNITYNIDRYVVWAQRVSPNDTRRYVVIVNWIDRFNNYKEVRYEAERVPSPEEAAPTSDGLKVLYFSISPNPVDLGSANTPVDGDGDPRDIQITLRTNKPLSAATLTYEYLVVTDNPDPDPDTYTKALATVSLKHDPSSTAQTTDPDTGDPYTGFVAWSYTITSPPTSPDNAPNIFYNGLSTFSISADNACTPCDDTQGAEFVTFRNGPVDDPGGTPSPTPTGTGTPTPTGTATTTPPPSGPLAITNATPLSFCVDRLGGTLKANYVMNVTVTGLNASNPAADGTMTVTYFKRDGHKHNKPNDYNNATGTTIGNYDSASTKWKITLPSGEGYWHWGYNSGNYDFFVKMTRSDTTSVEEKFVVHVTQCP